MAYPSLIVIDLTYSSICLTVLTPDIAFTNVDLPCATCPIVPILIVACLDIEHIDSGVIVLISSYVYW